MGDALGAVSTIAGAFGGSDGGDPSSGSSSSVSGYAALPPQAQAAYNNYFDLVNKLGLMNMSAFPRTNVNAPQSPFDSQELYKLQQATPNTPIQPTGYLEPFNQYQKSALGSMGAPDYSQAGLSQYTNPYQQMVQDNAVNEVNRSYDMSQNGIMDNNSRLNSRAMGSSLGTQLAQNNDNRARTIADTTAGLGYQGYNSAIDLRNQALQQQLAAGTAIQGQNQQLLSASNPQGQFALDPAYMQASLLGPLFGAFPSSSQSSSTQTGATPQTASATSRAGGLGMSLFGGGGNFLSGLFG